MSCRVVSCLVVSCLVFPTQDGREFFSLPFGAAYFFPDTPPAFAVEGAEFPPGQTFQGVSGSPLEHQQVGRRMDVAFTCRCDPEPVVVTDIVDTVEAMQSLKNKALVLFRERHAAGGGGGDSYPSAEEDAALTLYYRGQPLNVAKRNPVLKQVSKRVLLRHF